MQDKLRALEERYDSLTEEMGRPEVITDYQRVQALAKERASIEGVVSIYRDLRKVEDDIAEARALMDEGGDAEMARLAHEEMEALEPEHERLEQALRLALLPTDPHDERNVIVE